MSSDQDLIKAIDTAWEEAYEIIQSTNDWKMNSTDAKTGDTVESKKNKQGRKIWRAKAKISMPAHFLIDALQDVKNMTSWNKSLQHTELLKEINDKVSLAYSVTEGKGPVACRDFVFGSKADYKGEVFFIGGCSVEYTDGVPSSNHVRAMNGPGGYAVTKCADDKNKCEVVWLMDCDYKGFIPQAMMDIAMPFALAMFMESVRDLATKLQNEDRF